MVPLQVGVPGGAELLIVLIIAILLFGVPIALVAGGLYFYRQSKSDRPASEEIEALRREVERLREEVEGSDGEE